MADVAEDRKQDPETEPDSEEEDDEDVDTEEMDSESDECCAGEEEEKSARNPCVCSECELFYAPATGLVEELEGLWGVFHKTQKNAPRRPTDAAKNVQNDLFNLIKKRIALLSRLDDMRVNFLDRFEQN